MTYDPSVHLDQPRVRTGEVAPEDPALTREGARTEAVLSGRLALAMRLGVLATLVLGVVLRLIARSPLWLDEALTVDISRRPLGAIPHLLRDDGAPPLYYFLLHFWMKLVGTGNVAVRALAGLCGIVNLPLAWLAGFRVGSRWWSLPKAGSEERAAREQRGRTTAWAVTLILTASPFAVYYDTEARMYALVLLLGTVALIVATSLLRRPGPLPALALAVVAACLLYSHYWSLYVCAVAAVVAVVASFRGPHRRAARYGLAALVAAGIAFVPWLPTFLFQLRHTGTPWATPANYTAIVYAFTQFAGGDSTPGRALALALFFLLLLALFGAPVDGRHVMLDLRTRPGVRLLIVGVVATLFLAILAGRVSGSTFADRYTSVIAFPAFLVFAYGVTVLSDARVRAGVLALLVVLGFAAAIPNATLLRTQAGQVATAIDARATAGDVVAFCPDQLGPSVSRLVTAPVREITFPRGAPPQIVDWVDYLATVGRAIPSRFAGRLERLAGRHLIFLVQAPGYEGFGNKCEDLALDLGRHRSERMLVADRPADTSFEIYEGMSLEQFSGR